MKANELAVFDWLLINDEPRKVELVTKKKVGYHTKQNECKMHYARLCEVKPIPITLEILKKNGFDVKYYSLSQKYVGFIELSDKAQCLVSKVCENAEYADIYLNNNIKFYYYTLDMRINYVHELQHALRLCKIDKEIKI